MTLDCDARRAADDLHASVRAVDIPELDGLVRRDRVRRARNATLPSGLAVVLIVSLFVANWPSGGSRRVLPPATSATVEEIQAGWSHTAGNDAGFGTGSRRILATTSWKGGFAASGYTFSNQDDLKAAVWTSADGERWVPADLAPEANSMVEAVVSRGDELVAIAKIGGDAVVWRSNDGAAWQQVARSSNLFPVPGIGGGFLVRHAVSRGDRVVVLGMAEDNIGRLWTSDDLTTWTKRGVVGSTTFAISRLVAQDGSVFGIVGVGATAPPLTHAWRSDDGGRTWSEYSRTLAAAAPNAAILQLARTDGFWIGTGQDDASAKVGAWISDDLETWTSLPEKLLPVGVGIPLDQLAVKGGTAVTMDSGASDLYVWHAPQHGSAPEVPATNGPNTTAPTSDTATPAAAIPSETTP